MMMSLRFLQLILEFSHFNWARLSFEYSYLCRNTTASPLLLRYSDLWWRKPNPCICWYVRDVNVSHLC